MSKRRCMVITSAHGVPTHLMPDMWRDRPMLDDVACAFAHDAQYMQSSYFHLWQPTTAHGWYRCLKCDTIAICAQCVARRAEKLVSARYSAEIHRCISRRENTLYLLSCETHPPLTMGIKLYSTYNNQGDNH